MCGRYVTASDAAMERELAINARNVEAWLKKGFQQNFDTRPSTPVPILTVIRDQDGERTMETMRWGLVPFWTRGVIPTYSTLNAMAETLATKPAYRGPWQKGQRCVFPAAGFYEWQLQPDGKTKHRYYIRPAGDDEIFAIGGLWDISVNTTGEEIISCTLIVVPANELMAEIHNTKQRMPLILHKADIDTWLTGTTDEAQRLLQPFPSELMRAHRVVNDSINKGPELIQPVM